MYSRFSYMPVVHYKGWFPCRRAGGDARLNLFNDNSCWWSDVVAAALVGGCCCLSYIYEKVHCCCASTPEKKNVPTPCVHIYIWCMHKYFVNSIITAVRTLINLHADAMETEIKQHFRCPRATPPQQFSETSWDSSYILRINIFSTASSQLPRTPQTSTTASSRSLSGRKKPGESFSLYV